MTNINSLMAELSGGPAESPRKPGALGQGEHRGFGAAAFPERHKNIAMFLQWLCLCILTEYSPAHIT